MTIVWPSNSPPFQKLQLQDPSRRGKLISTSVINGMMAFPVTDLPSAMLIDADFVVGLIRHQTVYLNKSIFRSNFSFISEI